MKNLIAGILLFISFFQAQAQNWSKEEKEFLDYFRNNYKLFENKKETYELWKSISNPDENLVWWWTHQSLPNDLEAVKVWHLNFEKEDKINGFFDIRVIALKVIGEVGMVWYTSYGRNFDKVGNAAGTGEKRLELFRKDGARWKFIGGMVDPGNLN